MLSLLYHILSTPVSMPMSNPSRRSSHKLLETEKRWQTKKKISISKKKVSTLTVLILPNSVIQQYLSPEDLYQKFFTSKISVSYRSCMYIYNVMSYMLYKSKL